MPSAIAMDCLNWRAEDNQRKLPPSVFYVETLYSLPSAKPNTKEDSVGKQTPFYDLHLKANAKMVDFAGWEMPLHYGSQLQEHHQVRQHAGMFDVSHMGVVDLRGPDATSYLRRLLANNVERLVDGKALYTCMLNEKGGVIDDLIVYRLKDNDLPYRDQCRNSRERYGLDATASRRLYIALVERTDLAMLAIQGPEAKDKICYFSAPSSLDIVRNLKPFTFAAVEDLFIARTGYTGEDGYEIILPVTKVGIIWQLSYKQMLCLVD